MSAPAAFSAVKKRAPYPRSSISRRMRERFSLYWQAAPYSSDPPAFSAARTAFPSSAQTG